ncbi:MAG: hypothetical protein BHW65_03710 [Verrucomicrobia bacterium CAG:312_58_20]|nr:MAG: hypothetical protein BHW65_03710 [Verrucomicrobia bacterium CAG:312_58_20]
MRKSALAAQADARKFSSPKKPPPLPRKLSPIAASANPLSERQAGLRILSLILNFAAAICPDLSNLSEVNPQP